MPECVSFWDTKEWKKLKEEFNFEDATFSQDRHGGAATKPTTMASNLNLNVESHRMPRCNVTKIKSSSELSRWAPGTMSMVAEALLTQIVHCQPKLAPLSWQEHLQHGHVPFRRDCLVCQQSLQQQPPHRKVKHPLGGVLSVDTAGPFIRAYDSGGYKTGYILVGALTWTVPKGSPLKEDQVEELEEEAPNFDAKKGEEQDQPQIEDEPAEHEPAQGIFGDPEEEIEEPEVQNAPEGEAEKKGEKAEEEKKEGEEEENPAEFETRVF